VSPFPQCSILDPLERAHKDSDPIPAAGLRGRRRRDLLAAPRTW
jgi:hypothetical protein